MHLEAGELKGQPQRPQAGLADHWNCLGPGMVPLGWFPDVRQEVVDPVRSPPWPELRVLFNVIQVVDVDEDPVEPLGYSRTTDAPEVGVQNAHLGFKGGVFIDLRLQCWCWLRYWLSEDPVTPGDDGRLNGLG